MSRSEAGGAHRYQGSLYQFTPDLTPLKRLERVSISNGLCWSPDGATMYYVPPPPLHLWAPLTPQVDSPERTIVAYPCSPSGALGPPQPLVRLAPSDLPQAVFDGLTIDGDGALWVALWDGGEVRRYDTKDGSLLGRVPLPCPKPTSLCFGPTPLELYVTSADEGDSLHHPLAGKTFLVRLKREGGATSAPPLWAYKSKH